MLANFGRDAVRDLCPDWCCWHVWRFCDRSNRMDFHIAVVRDHGCGRIAVNDGEDISSTK